MARIEKRCGWIRQQMQILLGAQILSAKTCWKNEYNACEWAMGSRYNGFHRSAAQIIQMTSICFSHAGQVYEMGRVYSSERRYLSSPEEALEGKDFLCLWLASNGDYRQWKPVHQ